MASETVPAAANGPHDPATNPAVPSGLAGALARIEPVRGTTAAFSLDSAADEAGATSSTSSSSAYHDADTTPMNPQKNSTGKAQQPREGVFKTVLRAAAERWRKGADIHLKRLDMQKARHQASQVKETRQVVVNNATPSPSRTQKNSSGMGGNKGAGKASGGGSGKSGGGSGKAPKNSNGSTGSNTSAGRSGNTGKGAPGNGSAGAGRGRTDSHTSKGSSPNRDTKGSGSAGPGSKQPKTSTDRSKTSGAAGSGTATAGKAGKDGKPGKDASKEPSTSAKDTSKGATKDTGGKAKTSATDAKPSDAKTGKDSKTSKGATAAGGDARKKPGDGVDLTKKKTTQTADKDTANDDGKPGRGNNTAANHGTTKSDSTRHRTQQAPRTQSSREAGYRDGNRAARLVAHVEAYRDGTRDGWDDGRKTAAHDKDRLDTARTERLTQRKEPTMPPTTTAGPQPIPVEHINDTHVTLPGGHTHTRGEIRTVKQYERNLTEKAASLLKAAEATKALKQHAEEQAAKAAALAEQARSVEGGDKLIAALARLQEQATLQAGTAENLHTRAVRAAESTNTLLTNVETRYGGIYKAVCDSETTQPAKLFWYKDGAPAHV